MEVILSKRRRKIILCQSYKFSCKLLTKNGHKLRCTKKIVTLNCMSTSVKLQY